MSKAVAAAAAAIVVAAAAAATAVKWQLQNGSDNKDRRARHKTKMVTFYGRRQGRS